MKHLRQMFLGAAAATLLAHAPAVKADTTNATPEFKEVYELIRSHLAGATDTDLNRAAVQGLLSQLHARVGLASGSTATNGAPEAPLVSKSVLYDGPIAYVRVGRVGQGLADQVRAAYKELSNKNTNQLKGLVLDLRFTDGHDYAAAAATADIFLGKEAPLLDWGNGFIQSKTKSDAVNVPVAVLVNHQTEAAAEALAAVMRQADRALVLGSTTAGAASIDQEFPLKNGQSLRIATATIKLGNEETLSPSGVTPDISVVVSPEEEKAYYADPFKDIVKPSNVLAALSPTGAASGTNPAPRKRLSEADLIRERKEEPGKDLDNMDLDNGAVARDAELQKPVVRDPVLARALDLIKGISVLHSSR